MQFVQPITFQEAVDLIGDKSPIGAMLSSSEWSDVPVALRLRAMFSANVENVRFLQRAQDSLGDFLEVNRTTLPTGETMLASGGRAAFIQQLREFALAEGMGPLDPADAGGLEDITSERRLGLIFDTLTPRPAITGIIGREWIRPCLTNFRRSASFVCSMSRSRGKVTFLTRTKFTSRRIQSGPR